MRAGQALAVGALAAVCLLGGLYLWNRSRDVHDVHDVGEPAASGPVEALEREAKSLYAQQLYDRAADAYLKAADLAEQGGDPRRARQLRAQSAIPLKMAGRVDEARALLLPALEAARAEGDSRSEGLALGNLVRVEDLSDNPAGALAYRDALIEWAASNDDPRLEVWTLEQAAVNAARLGDIGGALARIERALKRDELLQGEERRHDALLGQQAGLHAEAGDAEGAWAIWSGMQPTAAALANRALYLARWALHAQAIETAWRAAEAFEAEGSTARVERDRALLLYLSELLVARDFDECSQQLGKILQRAAGEEGSLAPFRVVRARLALAQGRGPEALDDLRAVRSVAAGAADAEDVGLLLVAALLGRGAEGEDEAQQVLDSLPESQARSLLLGSLLLRRPPSDRLIGEALGEMRPAARRAGDDTLRTLRDQFPLGLPSMAVLALEVGLADAQRLRVDGLAAPADATLAAGLHDALEWQAEELEIPGWTPEPAQRQERSRVIDEWVAGRLADGHAVLAVLPGEAGSYLILCRAGQPATSFPLPAAAALFRQASEVVAALHDSDLRVTARAGWAYFRMLLTEAALADLAGLRDWIFILPDGLSGVPPALLVSSDPDAPELVAQPGAINWLVLDHTLALLPCAPMHAPTRATAAEAAVEPGSASESRWLSVGQPQVDSAAMPLAGHAWLDRFGLNVFNAGQPQALDGGETLSGGQASVAELRRLLPGLSGLRLSVPAAGCGLLGGLAFAPSAESPWGDENVGLLPWYRLPQLELPPELIIDAARFAAEDQRYGPSWAAACALVRADSLLTTRWPVREDLRQAFIARIALARGQGLPLAAALAAVQRNYLLEAFKAGDLAAMQPQFWAAWLAYDGV